MLFVGLSRSVSQQRYSALSVPGYHSPPGHAPARFPILNTSGYGRQSTYLQNHNVYGGQHSNTYQAVSRSYRPRYEPDSFHYHYHLSPGREIIARSKQIPKLNVHYPFHQKRQDPVPTLFNEQIEKRFIILVFLFILVCK